VPEEQQLPEYRQGDTVRLTVELRDENGVGGANAWAILQGSDGDDIYGELPLMGWAEGHPTQAEVVLEGEVKQQPPGVYECPVILAANAYHALAHHELSPPLCFRIVEDPDDVREGPELLSVGTFW
jgi:hypothetical protein